MTKVVFGKETVVGNQEHQKRKGRGGETVWGDIRQMGTIKLQVAGGRHRPLL